MRVLVQRVSEAKVTVGDAVTGAIGKGLLLLVGIHDTDTEAELRWMAEKCAKLRIFEDCGGKMNLSLQDVEGQALVVSQFTLYGDCKKGNRPSFNQAGKPDFASEMCDRFCVLLGAELGRAVPTGRFGAHMMVHLVNDGPVTLMLEREAG
ncbi:MAG: D-tyrosyl-tRNA(Tyr) deacylase [Deltaproteobacteria bacterium]|nr:D-tyrosyl-tRNA(Tyr) deacylase [Deltaproteobacteria bacterium]